MASFAVLGSNMPAGGKVGIFFAMITVACILHAVFKSTSQKDMERKIESLRTDLVNQILIRTETSAEPEKVASDNELP